LPARKRPEFGGKLAAHMIGEFYEELLTIG
jgi:hypothetical protein